jgi:hypothetical protein
VKRINNNSHSQSSRFSSGLASLKRTSRTTWVLFILTAATVPLTGCIVQSLNPYFTKESICTIPGIAGEWTLLDEQGKAQSLKPWVFGSDKVLTYDKNGAQGVVDVVYFSIGKTFFLDTIANGPEEESNKWWAMHLFPVHVVTKVEIHDNRLTLIPIDYAWLEKALKNGGVKLPHVLQKDEDFILFTATSDEWMAFLKKYSHDRNVFSDKNAVRFIK